MSELPKGWGKSTLGEICSKPQYGYTTKADPNNGSVKFLRTTDITKGRLDWDTVPFCMEAPSDLNKYQLVVGDIVIARSGSVGVSYLIDKSYEPAVFASYLIRFKPITPVLSRYVKAFLDSHLFWEQVEINKAGNALQNINAQKLSAISLPLAPLAEQKRIVAKLDEVLAQVDTIKARLDRIPAILKRFRQSVLAAAVSGKLTEEWRGRKQIQEAWREVTLKDLTLSISDGDHQAPPKAESGVPFLVISNVSSGFIDFQKVTRWVPKEYFGSLKDVRVPKKGDLLYTVTGSFGIPVKVDTDTNFCFQRHIAIIKVNREIVSGDFLYYWLLSPIAFMQAESTATGTAQKTVSLTSLRNFDFNLPRLEEQTEIVRLVDQYFAFADTIEAQVKKAQARVDNLTQSILAKAFRGELVAQDPNDEPAEKLLERIAKARSEAEQLAKAAKKAVKAGRKTRIN
ncbi:restriction endonuclease subunit S [Vibrio fujianensis]|uniref:restriction endonuclease subunit S n=1 Tax=Vibrio fujianensis TaxID=1974215 RepID=UPI000C163916|nr:restriction endonuclease subunit S [Vibrio fujianensis]